MVLVTGELKTPEEASTSAEIEGSYDFEGVKCRTAYELLKDEIAKHNPKRFPNKSRFPSMKSTRLADICIDGPVYHYEGYGPQAYNNGAHTTMAGLTLCALLGNLGKAGRIIWRLLDIRHRKQSDVYGPKWTIYGLFYPER